ncbi:5'-AMP-activated protein kinase, gamma subunit [Heracleum sosnowskyi]|uniref:5'-AMP-activated protein kinase, gamma subunit n=1 Tax=Heracleum sosnowskyi TaxID=360622 RepID=A0AAD8HXJ8_9APIA|nr:5'-AMP-activated protein kinase, gamma subunit [Heracleum sosnowskyi]
MAVSILAREVSDLCLGKPPLRLLPISSTVAESITALKRSGESYVSVWSCESTGGDYICVGKICMVDVICFLCNKESLVRPLDALQSPVSEILPKVSGIVRHLEPNTSLLEAIDYILEGTQNLIIPGQNNLRKRVLRKPSSFCWLTQEDVVRFLLNCIGAFSPIPTFTIESLNMIEADIMAVHYDSPASSILSLISRSHIEQSSIAVIDQDNRLIGEISPLTLACCNEATAAAIVTLSAGDLMAYIDCGSPSEELIQLVKSELQMKKLAGMLELLEEFSFSSSASSCSSDEELGSGRYSGSNRSSIARRSEAIVCYPWSSLMAVMIQALTHRVNCVWVVQEDFSLVGNVTLAGMLKVFRSIAASRNKK